MAKVIPFPQKPIKLDKTSIRLMQVADAIDTLILDNLHQADIEPHELAGLLAHRLGNLVHHIGGEDRERIIDICQQIISRQAEKESTG
jgi:hypothetical protein